MQPAVEQEQEEGGDGGEDRESGRQRDRDKETIAGGAERQTDSAGQSKKTSGAEERHAGQWKRRETVDRKRVTILIADLVGEPQRVVGETDDRKRETQSVRACQSKKTEYRGKGEMTAGAGREREREKENEREREREQVQPAVEQEQEEGGDGGEDRESGRQRDRDKETIAGGAERQTDSAGQSKKTSGAEERHAGQWKRRETVDRKRVTILIAVRTRRQNTGEKER